MSEYSHQSQVNISGVASNSLFWIAFTYPSNLFFTKNAVGGPGRPAIQSIPDKLTQQTIPNKRPRATPPSRPPKRNSWGNVSDTLLQMSLRN